MLDGDDSSWLHPRAILRKFINRLVFLLNSINAPGNFYSGIICAIRTIIISRTIVTAALCQDYFRFVSIFFARVLMGKRIIVFSFYLVENGI